MRYTCHILPLLIVLTLSCKHTSTRTKLAAAEANPRLCENRKPDLFCQDLSPSSPSPDRVESESAKLVAEGKNPAIEFCKFYKESRECFADNCSRPNKLRLQGYQNVCERVSAASLADNELTIGETCADTPRFVEFANNMRFCLQQSAHALVSSIATAPGQPCRSCSELVEGIGTTSANLDVATGVIGAHSVCAMKSGLSRLEGHEWGCFLRGFGYGFGELDVSALDQRGSGPLLATGLCHSMMMGLLGAAERVDFEQMIERETLGSLCESFRTGCMQNPNNNQSCLSCPAFLHEPLWNKAFATTIGAMRRGVSLAYPNEADSVGLRVGLLGAFEHSCVSLIGRNELADILKSGRDLKQTSIAVASELLKFAQAAGNVPQQLSKTMGEKIASAVLSPTNGKVLSPDGRVWSCFKCRKAYKFESAKYYVKGGWSACNSDPHCGWALESDDRKSAATWRQQGIRVEECGLADKQMADYTTKSCSFRTRVEFEKLTPKYSFE